MVRLDPIFRRLALDYRRLQWGSYATKQPLSKHGSRKMLSVANGSFLSTDILAPGSQGVYLTFIVKPRGIHMKNEAVLALLYIDEFFAKLLASQASIGVRTVNCHPGDPSSIPCPASSFFFKNLFVFLQRTAVILRFRGEKTPNLRLNTPWHCVKKVCKYNFLIGPSLQ